MILPFQRGEGDDVVFPDIPQRAKERIAMPRDANVSPMPRQGCSTNMSDGPAKSSTAGAFDDDHRNIETGDVDAAEQAS